MKLKHQSSLWRRSMWPSLLSVCTFTVFLLTVLAAGFATVYKKEVSSCDSLPGPDQAEIEVFVRDACYEEWTLRPRHLSGTVVDGVEYAVHQEVEVFYTPGVADWLENGRSSSIQDGEIIVAVEYPVAGNRTEAQWIHTRVKQGTGSWDGWFWSTTSPLDETTSKGAFGAACISCHASADNNELVFLDPEGMVDTDAWVPEEDLRWPEPPPATASRAMSQPHAEADPGFLALYDVQNVSAADIVSLPSAESDHVPAAPPANQADHPFVTSDQCMACHNANQLLSNSRPNMWYPDPQAGDSIYRNYSPYGEWSASIKANAARDPIFFAQVESERYLRSETLSPAIEATCMSCHGPMAGRQIEIDEGGAGLFGLDMLYAEDGTPEATYGALGRDGISCVVCHQMAGTNLGVDPDFDGRGHLNPDQLFSYTGLFDLGAPNVIYGPYEKVIPAPMLQGQGYVPQVGPQRDPQSGTNPDADDVPQIGEAALCGTCHTVAVPVVPDGYKDDNPLTDPGLATVFEQTTYWEWRNSLFQNEMQPAGLPCQGCHMPEHRGGNGDLLAQRIANIQSNRFPPAQAIKSDDGITMAEQEPYSRHTLWGINLFALEMFEQFPDILGTGRHDPSVPEQTLDPLLNAGDWVSDHAEFDTVLVEVLSTAEIEGNLEAQVQISNFAGHKLPTGSGSRRAFVRFEVLDELDNILWASGLTNEYGVILDGDGVPLASEFTFDPAESQPHHTVITDSDQVQIYESRSLDAPFDEGGQLQSTVLGLAAIYKDNRILPLGWATENPEDRETRSNINIYATHPFLPGQGGVAPLEEATGDAPEYCSDPAQQMAYDPDYCDPEHTRRGSDTLIYRIPLEEVPNWAKVRARVFYQAIPPYYLMDRFRDGIDPQTGEPGRDTQRLIYITSRLNSEGSAIENWSIQIGNNATRRKQ